MKLGRLEFTVHLARLDLDQPEVDQTEDRRRGKPVGA